MFIKPEELTRLFCLRNLQSKSSKDDPLLSDEHRIAIADYVNEQILQHIDSGNPVHLNQMLRQCTLNINYGLNNFYKHRLFDANPIVKKK